MVRERGEGEKIFLKNFWKKVWGGKFILLGLV